MKNEPAFPGFEKTDQWTSLMPSGGMTLRDYFAAKVLPTLIAKLTPAVTSGEAASNIESAVKVAFAIADAALAEREKLP